jgi:hypothetical protein
MGLTVVAASAAGAVAFAALYRLRDDPSPALGEAYRLAAFLQPLPFVAAAAVAVGLRRRPAVLAFTLAAVVGCGAFGGWWLSGPAETRRVENEPVRRNALGNILPDFGGEAGAVEAFLWPVAAAGVVGVLTLIGWATTRNSRPRRAAGPARATG